MTITYLTNHTTRCEPDQEGTSFIAKSILEKGSGVNPREGFGNLGFRSFYLRVELRGARIPISKMSDPFLHEER